MKPYLTLSLTEQCNMRCVYCPPAGENYHTQRAIFSLPKLSNVLRLAAALDLGKVRFTGGEPLLYPDLRAAVEAAAGWGLEVHINTNGLLLEHHLGWMSAIPNLQIKVSLDAVLPQTLERISGVNRLEQILNGLRWGAQLGLVRRINFVLTRLNADQFPGVLDLCRSLGVGLKVFDMFPVPETALRWQELYQAVDELPLAGEVLPEYPYAAHFGTPTRELCIRGVHVRIKSCLDGTHYHPSCENCPFFPCPEGLYCLMVTPSLTVVPCRLGEQHFCACRDLGQVRAAIEQGLELYAHSYYARLYTGGLPSSALDLLCDAGRVAVPC